MAITSVKIHPAIGIARVGNSPDEWFIGPETADMPPIPIGGYKDANCRIKRQAARFRVFAYHDNGPPTELTATDATIAWTVQVANKKASASARNTGVADRSKLEITPAAQTVTGPNAQAAFAGGSVEFPGAAAVTVDLGEIRTDTEGRLVVLGGHGTSQSPTNTAITSFLNNDNWYDDVADGPVSATVTINAQTFQAVGAWVIVAPPDFAPTVRPVITLYDRLYEHYRSNGLFGLSFPDPIRFRTHIHPLLEATVRHRGVRSDAASAHGTLSESLYPMSTAQKTAIVSRLKQEGSTMPVLASAELTATQYEMLKRWRDNHASFVDDWATPPQPIEPTPDELDRGPLSHSVGATFFPGIEAGQFLVNSTTIWIEPFRLDPTQVAPGAVSQTMACPWQADFWACTGIWWPSQRPGQTIQQSTGTSHEWSTLPNYQAMVDNWHTLGFVVPQGNDLVEVETCGVASITLLTPLLDFVDVPQGPGGVAVSRALAVHFEVDAPTVAATFRISSGAAAAPFSRVTTGDVSVGPTSGAPADAYLWIRYTTQAVGSSATGSVVVEHVETGRQWTVALRGNTVARKTTAVSLVLDRSGSMNEPRGDGVPKIVGLKEAAKLFVRLAHEGDGIGAVQYNADVQGDIAIAPLGSILDPLDPARTAVTTFVDALVASGGTSIGDGLERGRQLLDATSVFDREAMVVITDGKETSPKWISDVAGTIDATTYGLGIGTAANINAATLQALTGNSGGYLLVTGPLVGDTEQILMKYFLQILAGISNADVLLDPEGHIAIDDEIRIPFTVSDADLMLDVVLLSPVHRLIDLRVETPLGFVLRPSSIETDHVETEPGEMLRFRVPLELAPGRIDQAGTWHVVLSGPATPGGGVDVEDGNRDEQIALWKRLTRDSSRGTARYSVIVNVYSDVSFRATLRQNAATPGARVDIDAVLTHFGAPFSGQAGAFAEITDPSGVQRRVDLQHDGDGRFSGAFVAGQAGVHRVRVRCAGRTPSGWQFHREHTQTAVVADHVPGSSTPEDGDRNGRLCKLIGCLLTASGSKRFRFWTWLFGVDRKTFEACVARWCRDGSAQDDR